jgi:hypothetical protein
MPSERANAVQSGYESVFVHQKHLCHHAGDEALEAEDVEHAGGRKHKPASFKARRKAGKHLQR